MKRLQPHRCHGAAELCCQHCVTLRIRTLVSCLLSCSREAVLTSACLFVVVGAIVFVLFASRRCFLGWNIVIVVMNATQEEANVLNRCSICELCDLETLRH